MTHARAVLNDATATALARRLDHASKSQQLLSDAAGALSEATEGHDGRTCPCGPCRVRRRILIHLARP